MKRNRLKQGITLLHAGLYDRICCSHAFCHRQRRQENRLWHHGCLWELIPKVLLWKMGTSYLWGRNDSDQIGNGGQYDGFIPGYEWPLQTTPVKVLENVASAELDYITSAAVTKDGDLYTWGNANGVHQLTPQKIMSGVSRVVVSGIYAAITNSGDLYTWGSNHFGQVGNGTGKSASLVSCKRRNLRSSGKDHGECDRRPDLPL